MSRYIYNTFANLKNEPFPKNTDFYLLAKSIS